MKQKLTNILFYITSILLMFKCFNDNTLVPFFAFWISVGSCVFWRRINEPSKEEKHND